MSQPIARSIFAAADRAPGMLLTRQPLGPADGSAAPAHLQGALQTLQGASAEVRTLLSAYRDEMAGAHRATAGNKNLSPAGVADMMAQLRADIQSRYNQQAQALANRLDTASRTLDTAAAAATPPAKTGVEAMLARQAAWSRARTLLDAGVVADQLVREATDPETLHMLLDEVPTYLRAQGMTDDGARYFYVCVQRQWAALAPTDAQAGAILIDMQAIPHEAYAAPLVEHMLAETSGQAAAGGFMEAALRAELARQQAAMALTGGLVTEPSPQARALPNDRSWQDG